MPTIVVGQRVDRHTIVRLIATGGQGAVYETIREDIGQRGALKVLHLHGTSAAASQRFINEARAVNAIRHPNIPQALDFGQLEDGTPWIVYDFLEGESLEARITKRRLTLEETLTITEDVASALDAAHQKNIIHRDVKPSNAFLVADDQRPFGERAMVLDFGIAKLVQAETLTGTGNIVGTPIYMAYEQVDHAKLVDGKADVYSLGVMVFQMLCRRLPFRYQREAGTYAILAAKLDPPTPIEKYAPDLPAELRDLINAMVQKNRGQRPTMAEVRLVMRRMQGLPPPKQTGSHDAIGPPASLEPVQGPLDHDDHEDPTGSAVSSFISAQEVGPTPSEQTARGEISPAHPPLPIPKSISDQPSLPVVAPFMRAGPEESTARPAPTQLIAEAKATPSSPTMAAGQAPNPMPPAPPKEAAPSRRRVVPWLVAALAVGVGLTAITLRRAPSPMIRSGAPVDPAPPITPAVVAPSPPPATTAAPLPATVANPLPSTLASTNGSNPSDVSPVETKEAIRQPAPTSAKPVGREPQPPNASCIVTEMTSQQRNRLLSAFRSSGAKFRPGERLVLGGFPHYPKILTAPPSLDEDSKPAYELTGLLKGADLPAQVELRCRK